MSFVSTINQTTQRYYFQDEVLETAGQEGLDLGLLAEVEDFSEIQDEDEHYVFQHRMFEEFASAKNIADLSKVEN